MPAPPTRPNSTAATPILRSRAPAPPACAATSRPRSPTTPGPDERRPEPLDTRATGRAAAPARRGARPHRPTPPLARPARGLPADRRADVRNHLPRRAGDRRSGGARREAPAGKGLLLQRLAPDGGDDQCALRRIVEIAVSRRLSAHLEH